MRKIILMLLLTTLLVYLGGKAQSQDFDRLLEKNIKIEINLNRIAKSQSPLSLSFFRKKMADSINHVTFQSYLSNVQVNAAGSQEDWKNIWPIVENGMDKDIHANYNILIIKDGDYVKKLREHLYDKEAFYYKLENSDISLSAIRYDNMVFLTVLTW